MPNDIKYRFVVVPRLIDDVDLPPLPQELLEFTLPLPKGNAYTSKTDRLPLPANTQEEAKFCDLHDLDFGHFLAVDEAYWQSALCKQVTISVKDSTIDVELLDDSRIQFDLPEPVDDCHHVVLTAVEAITDAWHHLLEYHDPELLQRILDGEYDELDEESDPADDSQEDSNQSYMRYQAQQAQQFELELELINRSMREMLSSMHASWVLPGLRAALPASYTVWQASSALESAKSDARLSSGNLAQMFLTHWPALDDETLRWARLAANRAQDFEDDASYEELTFGLLQDDLELVAKEESSLERDHSPVPSQTSSVLVAQYLLNQSSSPLPSASLPSSSPSTTMVEIEQYLCDSLPLVPAFELQRSHLRRLSKDVQAQYTTLVKQLNDQVKAISEFEMIVQAAQEREESAAMDKERSVFRSTAAPKPAKKKGGKKKSIGMDRSLMPSSATKDQQNWLNARQELHEHASLLFQRSSLSRDLAVEKLPQVKTEADAEAARKTEALASRDARKLAIVLKADKLGRSLFPPVALKRHSKVMIAKKEQAEKVARRQTELAAAKADRAAEKERRAQVRENRQRLLQPMTELVYGQDGETLSGTSIRTPGRSRSLRRSEPIIESFSEGQIYRDEDTEDDLSAEDADSMDFDLALDEPEFSKNYDYDTDMEDLGARASAYQDYVSEGEDICIQSDTEDAFEMMQDFQKRPDEVLDML